MAKNANEITVIDPLRATNFGLALHKYRQFNAIVPGTFKDADLENPKFWGNVANQMDITCEVRCVADDMSFVAYGICTFVQGSTVKIKIYQRHELDAVDHDAMNDVASDYVVKLRGPKRWSIVKTSTGEVIKEDIATQLEAMRDLEDFKKALRS